MDGRDRLNFSSYDYLGLNGDPRVADAAKDAIDQYGVSVSASRLVAGERPFHRELESALARVYEAEDCLLMVSGHATNVNIIGHLFAREDLILHDALSHNSIVQGAQMAGSQRLSFPHNDAGALEGLLEEHRGRFSRVLIVIEGHYSMDGDTPDLAAFAELAERYGCWLMVDEAHALGVLGATGRGTAEQKGVAADRVDLWMGTLSKSLAGCGGYVAGKSELIDYLRHTAPGFVYSVGMAAPLAAASLRALDILLEEPERVGRLRANAELFRREAKSAGLDTGSSEGFSIVPIIIGSSINAARLSERLLERDINVQPILHPAVPERSARLRFFLSSDHRESEIRHAVTVVADEIERLAADSLDMHGLLLALSNRR
jgi:8-amino-7-oxononanoate synthase